MIDQGVASNDSLMRSLGQDVSFTTPMGDALKHWPVAEAPPREQVQSPADLPDQSTFLGGLISDIQTSDVMRSGSVQFADAKPRPISYPDPVEPDKMNSVPGPEGYKVGNWSIHGTGLWTLAHPEWAARYVALDSLSITVTPGQAVEWSAAGHYYTR